MEPGITGIHHVRIGVRPEDEAACRAGGMEIVSDLQPIEEWERFYVCDPAGVRVEFAQVRRT